MFTLAIGVIFFKEAMKVYYYIGVLLLFICAVLISMAGDSEDTDLA
jgi:drug/metabolite transporter (DMT)-like permease